MQHGKLQFKTQCFGEQGWCSGNCTHLLLVWPRFNSRFVTTCRLSWLLVVHYAPRGFSAGSPVFPYPQKLSIFPNSNSIRNHFCVSEASSVKFNIINYYLLLHSCLVFIITTELCSIFIISTAQECYERCWVLNHNFSGCIN